MIYVLLLFFMSLGAAQKTLLCYSCISQVPLQLVQHDAKLAFKTFMFTRYNIPSSHAYCADSEAYEFKTADVQNCEATDSCIKLRVNEQGIDFVMRGCVSKLFKGDYQMSSKISCNSNVNAACLCQTDLCNSSHFPFSFVILIFLASLCL